MLLLLLLPNYSDDDDDVDDDEVITEALVYEFCVYSSNRRTAVITSQPTATDCRAVLFCYTAICWSVYLLQNIGSFVHA